MHSKFFIDHPIFSCVISILIVIAGLVAYDRLPIAKYPQVTPPVVRVKAMYPGASAQVLADTVAAPIEQEVNGVDNMIYMSSTSSSDGQYQLDVTFELGTNVDMATVLVQNRVNVAEPRLPDEVKRQGVTVRKVSTSMVGVAALTSPDGRYDSLFLANYLKIYINDEVRRIPGVGDTLVAPDMDFGMRVWLDPERMRSRSLTVTDVIDALKEQNVQVAAGQIGQPPIKQGQDFQFTVNTLGRLKDEGQFADIILKAGEGGQITRLRDVAKVELGGKAYNMTATSNGVEAANLLVYQAPGANMVDVASKLRETLERLKNDFPPGLAIKITYDASMFVREAIKEVFKTLYEAVILVVLVILVFLQSWRTTLIPLLTIPVSLIGTFFVLLVMGFSINMLTLFGLILAIGIVVDDAIVVVENVERVMAETHLPAKDASIKAMGEVFSAIIAISLVLMAVFLPSTAMPGITGRLYQQFAVTIAVSTFFSAVNALTLSPALCAVLLRPHVKGHQGNPFSRVFNYGFERVTQMYRLMTAFLVSGPVRVFALAAFVAMLYLTVETYLSVPTGFLPNEDQGIVLVDVQLPDSASQQRTDAVLANATQLLKSIDGIKDAASVGGFSMLGGNGSNYAIMFAPLKPWEEREEHGRPMDKILGEVWAKLGALQEARLISFSMPPIDGLGSSSGFDLRLQDKTGLGGPVIEQVAQELVQSGNADPNLSRLNSSFRAVVPQLFADIDREKVKRLGVPLQSVFDTLQAFLGSTYVNDFNRFGRTFQVSIQADSAFRERMEDIPKLEVRAESGKMIPLGTLLRVNETPGPEKVFRYNMYPSASIIGEPAPGRSSGEALAAMESMAAGKLPAGMGYEWTAVSFQEKRVGNQAIFIYALSLLVVYLILAAQYESWIVPLSVILSVPLAVLGAMLLVKWRGMDNNVFTQIGQVLLIGLAAKNAILIVEFARENRARGMSLVESAVMGAKTRFRPILMTSFAFILGCVPLMFSSGAGAMSRQSLGTPVVGGMLGATVLGLIFTPVLYVIIQGLSELLTRKRGG